MTIPAFNANASLYRTSGHYQSVARQIYTSGGHGVIQIAARPTGCAGLEHAMGHWAGQLGSCAASGSWVCVQYALGQLDVAGEIYALSGC